MITFADGMTSIADDPQNRMPHTAPTVQCIHRGEQTREVKCNSCGDRGNMAQVFACEMHGECTERRAMVKKPIRSCLTCHDYRASKITSRTLIYHCCPLAKNDIWLDNMQQVLRHWGIFDRRYIAVARGDGLVDPADALQQIDQLHPGALTDAQWMILPNDPVIRETASFLPLLIAAQSNRSDEATFYAHTKGNSTRDNAGGAAIWRNIMYERLLGGWESCMQHLLDYAAVGVHKMLWTPGNWSPYPSGLNHGHWMLAGTFFWFRNDTVFGHRGWRTVPADRYGTEAYLSGLLKFEDVKSVYQVWPEELLPPWPSPYDVETYDLPEIGSDRPAATAQ